MKIKYIALLTLTTVALSGCSAIQAVANAADSALGAVNNGLDRLNVALGGESRNGNGNSGESKTFQLWQERNRITQERINIPYFKQNEAELVSLFDQWVLHSINANTYDAVVNKYNQIVDELAATQRERATYRAPEGYIESERREVYAQIMGYYNHNINALQLQREQMISFINQKFGSMQNLKTRLVQNSAQQRDVNHRMNAYCTALMRGKTRVEIPIRPRPRPFQRMDGVELAIVHSNDPFCGLKLIAKSIDATMDHFDNHGLESRYEMAWDRSKSMLGIEPVDPKNPDLIDKNESFWLYFDAYKL